MGFHVGDGLEEIAEAARRGARVVVVTQTGSRTTRERGEDVLVAECVRNARVLGPGGPCPRVLRGGFFGWRSALGLDTRFDPRSREAAIQGGWRCKVDALVRLRAVLESITGRRPAWDIFKPLYLAQIGLVFHDS